MTLVIGSNQYLWGYDLVCAHSGKRRHTIRYHSKFIKCYAGVSFADADAGTDVVAVIIIVDVDIEKKLLLLLLLTSF